MAKLSEVISCLSDYDPDALPVAKANEVIRGFVRPIAGVEKLPVRAALGRVLASVRTVANPVRRRFALHTSEDLRSTCVGGRRVVIEPCQITVSDEHDAVRTNPKVRGDDFHE